MATTKLDYLTVEQIQKAFAMSRHTVYKLAATGVLKAMKFQGSRRMYFDRAGVIQSLQGVRTDEVK